jgi:ketosteroid isomerase-like protein
MKRYLVHATALLLTAVAVHAQTGGSASDARARQNLTSLIEQLVTSHGGNDDLFKGLDRACVDAMVQMNIDGLAMIEADDFTFVSPDGSIMNKEQDLAVLRSGDIKYESVGLEGQLVRTYGDTGIVTGQANVKGRYRTFDNSGAYRYTVVFARRGQRWQAVTSQMTRIQAGGPPPAGVPK